MSQPDENLVRDCKDVLRTMDIFCAAASGIK
jgi:hypothetical protein